MPDTPTYLNATNGPASRLPEIYEHLAALRYHMAWMATVAEHRGGADGAIAAAWEAFDAIVSAAWVAGQTERRAMDLNEYDPPMWARGAFLDEVQAAVGRPAVHQVPLGARTPRRIERKHTDQT